MNPDSAQPKGRWSLTHFEYEQEYEHRFTEQEHRFAEHLIAGIHWLSLSLGGNEPRQCSGRRAVLVLVSVLGCFDAPYFPRPLLIAEMHLTITTLDSGL